MNNCKIAKIKSKLINTNLSVSLHILICHISQIKKYYSCSVNRCVFWAVNTPNIYVSGQKQIRTS